MDTHSLYASGQYHRTDRGVWSIYDPKCKMMEKSQAAMKYYFGELRQYGGNKGSKSTD